MLEGTAESLRRSTKGRVDGSYDTGTVLVRATEAKVAVEEALCAEGDSNMVLSFFSLYLSLLGDLFFFLLILTCA